MKKTLLVFFLFCLIIITSISTTSCNYIKDIFSEKATTGENIEFNITTIEEYKESILEGPYGKKDIEELLNLTLSTLDFSRNEMRLALLLRKNEALPLLKNRLHTGNDEDKYKLLMLVQGGLRWEELVPEIIFILNRPDNSDILRARAATAASIFGKREALPGIRNLLESADEVQARQFAAMALGYLGDTGAIELVESNLLYDESIYARITAAMVLGMLGSTAGEREALSLSRDEQFDIRYNAAEALSYIGTPEAMARLREMVENDPSSSVRNESAEYLARAELESLDRDEAVTMLENALKLAETSDLEKQDLFIPPRWAFVYMAEYFAPDAQEFLQELAGAPGPLYYPARTVLIELSADYYMIPYVRRPLK